MCTGSAPCGNRTHSVPHHWVRGYQELLTILGVVVVDGAFFTAVEHDVDTTLVGLGRTTHRSLERHVLIGIILAVQHHELHDVGQGVAHDLVFPLQVHLLLVGGDAQREVDVIHGVLEDGEIVLVSSTPLEVEVLDGLVVQHRGGAEGHVGQGQGALLHGGVDGDQLGEDDLGHLEQAEHQGDEQVAQHHGGVDEVGVHGMSLLWTCVLCRGAYIHNWAHHAYIYVSLRIHTHGVPSVHIYTLPMCIGRYMCRCVLRSHVHGVLILHEHVHQGLTRSHVGRGTHHITMSTHTHSTVMHTHTMHNTHDARIHDHHGHTCTHAHDDDGEDDTDDVIDVHY